jgi:hypothetical protein
MSPFELDAILTQYFNIYKNHWEQTRFISYITASCFASKQLTPQDIIKFSWDVEDQPEQLTPEQIEARKTAMFKHLQNNYHNSKPAKLKDFK